MIKRKVLQLYAGLVLLGFSSALMVRSNLGLTPWDVLHDGLSRITGWSFGSIVVACGAVVLLLWIPLRQTPGFGTISNVLVIGLVADQTLVLMPAQAGGHRYLLLILGTVLNGVATAAYIGAGLGPGPRDGLMTGIARRTDLSLGHVRGAIELGVLAIGSLLGGRIGLGTVFYAVAIGPIVHRMARVFTLSCSGAPAARKSRSAEL